MRRIPTTPTRRRATALAAAAGLLAAALPAAEAGAATLPAAPTTLPAPFVFNGPTMPAIPSFSLQPSAGSPLLTFTPPKVGQLIVVIGPTIIGGKVINPGLRVTGPTTLPAP
jgi:hypothetical protein